MNHTDYRMSLKKQKKLIWIVNPYESYESSIRMSHTDRRSVFKEKVKDILAISSMLLGVPAKILGAQSNCLRGFHILN